MFKRLWSRLFSSQNKILISQDDDGKDVHANTGDLVVLRLPSNPATGYLWMQGDTTAGHLEQVVHDQANKPGTEVLVTFVFKVAQTGDINLYYARPWDELATPKRLFSVHVIC